MKFSLDQTKFKFRKKKHKIYARNVVSGFQQQDTLIDAEDADVGIGFSFHHNVDSFAGLD
jgi:hypothetical protein